MARPGKSRLRNKPRHRPSGRSARGSKGSSNLIWGALLALMFVGVFGGGMWVMRFLADRPTYDQATLCPSPGPTAAMIVLLDLTDPLSNVQASRLSALLDNMIDKAPAGTMISLGVVSEYNENWGARFSLCKPESGEAASTLYQNPTLIAQSFQQNFQNPLEASIFVMMQAKAAYSAPF